MNDVSLVIFKEDDLPDYMDVILPNVWDELLTLESFEEAQVITLAVELDGNTLGAAVARIQDNAEVQIYSIYVKPEYRRRKVGTALLDGILTLAQEMLEAPELPEIPVVEVIDYTLDKEDLASFTAFLQSAGFRAFDDLPPLFILSRSAAMDHAGHPAGAGLLSELPDAEREAVEVMLEGFGIPAETELCTYAGPAQEPACMVLSFPSDNGDLMVSSYGEEASEEDYKAALSRMFAAIGEEYESFAILADGTRNLFPHVWEELGADVIHRTIARRNVMFTAERG